MCLNAWSPDSCALLGGRRAFGIWGPGGVRSPLEVVFDVYSCLLFQYCLLCSAQPRSKMLARTCHRT